MLSSTQPAVYHRQIQGLSTHSPTFLLPSDAAPLAVSFASPAAPATLLPESPAVSAAFLPAPLAVSCYYTSAHSLQTLSLLSSHFFPDGFCKAFTHSPHSSPFPEPYPPESQTHRPPSRSGPTKQQTQRSTPHRLVRQQRRRLYCPTQSPEYRPTHNSIHHISLGIPTSDAGLFGDELEKAQAGVGETRDERRKGVGVKYPPPYQQRP